MEENKKEHSEHHPPHVAVQIVTIDGNYPENGYKEYSPSELLQTILDAAKHHLKLRDTENWVAKLGGRTLDGKLSLESNNVVGKAQIMWGKDESGGGGPAN